MMRFVMELMITPEEIELVEPIHWNACASAALANDYWSWWKEASQNRTHEMRIFNGVVVLMNEKGMNTESALEELKQRSLDYELRTEKLCEELLHSGNSASRSVDFEKYVRAHLWFVAGNNYWSSTCPRYHKYMA